jgi:hypothetical protein
MLNLIKRLENQGILNRTIIYFYNFSYHKNDYIF